MVWLKFSWSRLPLWIHGRFAFISEVSANGIPRDPQLLGDTADAAPLLM